MNSGQKDNKRLFVCEKDIKDCYSNTSESFGNAKEVTSVKEKNKQTNQKKIKIGAGMPWYSSRPERLQLHFCLCVCSHDR